MAKLCPLTNTLVLYLECRECEVKYDCSKGRLKKMFGKPLEEYIGQVRKFKMGNATWEYTVKDIQFQRAVVEMVVISEDAQLMPIELYWDRGELREHGFD